MKISYQSPGKKIFKRTIDPYHAIRYDGDWYLIAYCHNRKSIRTFSLSRIIKAAILENSFDIPEDFDFEKISSSRFGIQWGGNEESVSIRFSAEATPYLLERNWHPSQEINEQPDGTTILNLKTIVSFELKRWLLSWGSQATVLKPPRLVNEMETEIRQMIKKL